MSDDEQVEDARFVHEAALAATIARAPGLGLGHSPNLNLGVRLGRPLRDLLATADPLNDLAGKWVGHGFNVIWRPFHPPDQSDHFLQLNLTNETLEFNSISTAVPNRGLNEPDIFFPAVQYLQQIADANFAPPQGGGALHFEPGIWISLPATPDTGGLPTVARMGSIPHGNVILAEGTGDHLSGPPVIDPVSITPFVVGQTTQTIVFPEQTVATAPQSFRNDPLPAGITQALVDNPNSLLVDANAQITAQGFDVTRTTVLHVATRNPAGVATGGIESIPFLNTSSSAQIPDMSATFWVMQWKNPTTGATCVTLQYSQTVLLNFVGLSWPHVTVGSLASVF